MVGELPADWKKISAGIIQDANEKAEKVESVLDEAQDGHADKNDERQSECHHDVAGEGKTVRHHAQQIAKQNEHEYCEHKGEIFSAFLADRVPKHVGNEFIRHFRSALPTARHNRATAHAQNHEAGN